jgi:hypothetical protein
MKILLIILTTVAEPGNFRREMKKVFLLAVVIFLFLCFNSAAHTTFSTCCDYDEDYSGMKNDSNRNYYSQAKYIPLE